jgi:hypothetical protein
MMTSVSTFRLPISRTAAHQRCQHAGRHVTTTDAPNEGANVDANADALPLFQRASQNLADATMLLCGCPEAATSEERRVRQQLKALLEAATAQQAERSASR